MNTITSKIPRPRTSDDPQRDHDLIHYWIIVARWTASRKHHVLTRSILRMVENAMSTCSQEVINYNSLDVEELIASLPEADKIKIKEFEVLISPN